MKQSRILASVFDTDARFVGGAPKPVADSYSNW